MSAKRERHSPTGATSQPVVYLHLQIFGPSSQSVELLSREHRDGNARATLARGLRPTLLPSPRFPPTLRKISAPRLLAFCRDPRHLPRRGHALRRRLCPQRSRFLG